MINAIKSWFFDKINNIDKTSANLKGGAEMRERKDSNKIRIERGKLELILQKCNHRRILWTVMCQAVEQHRSG